jgi:uncharacterized protein (TIGR00251 family)
MTAAWLQREAAGSVLLNLHIQPGAKRTGIVGLHGEALKIRLAAPPVDGKANAALLAFVAQAMGVPQSQVELVGGAASRLKRLRVRGASEEALGRLASKAG